MLNLVKIKTIKLSRLNNNEYSQFLKGVENLIKEASLDSLKIREDLFLSFCEHINYLTEVTKKTRSSLHTTELKKIDSQRSELAHYLLSTFKIELKSPIKLKQEAALNLFEDTKNYSGLKYLPLRQKTHLIKALLSDIKTPKNLKNLEALNLTYVADSLQEYNNLYDEITQNRAKHQVNNKTDNTRKIRRLSDQEYDHIISLSYAASLLHPNEKTKNFISLLNKLIDDTTIALKQRTAKRVKDKEEIPS